MATANLLFGDRNPFGKLTMPFYYNCLNTGRPKENDGQVHVSKYLELPNEPLLPFGFGLRYTTFSYSSPELLSHILMKGKSFLITVEVENTEQ